MKYKIALAGNPNSGKTTLFNCLTGSNLYVGNWPGVTVEKKEGNLFVCLCGIGKLLGPFPRSPVMLCFVGFEKVGDVGDQRVVGVGVG